MITDQANATKTTPAEEAATKAASKIALRLQELAITSSDGFTGELLLQINCAGSRNRDRYALTDKPAELQDKLRLPNEQAARQFTLAINDLRTRLMADFSAKDFWGSISLQLTIRRGQVLGHSVFGTRIS